MHQPGQKHSVSIMNGNHQKTKTQKDIYQDRSNY